MGRSASPSNEPSPFDVTYRQWNQLRDDFGRFCNKWAAIAAAIGCQPADLPGWDSCRPNTPIAKVLGIIWKLDGRAAVEITRDALVTARRDVYRRHMQHDPAGVYRKRTNMMECHRPGLWFVSSFAVPLPTAPRGRPVVHFTNKTAHQCLRPLAKTKHRMLS